MAFFVGWHGTGGCCLQSQRICLGGRSRGDTMTGLYMIPCLGDWRFLNLLFFD